MKLIKLYKVSILEVSWYAFNLERFVIFKYSLYLDAYMHLFAILHLPAKQKF